MRISLQHDRLADWPQAVPFSQPVLRRLRTRYNQTMTASGRLAMDELNLQCMPRPRRFSVPATQAATPADWGTVEHREHVANLRWVLRV